MLDRSDRLALQRLELHTFVLRTAETHRLEQHKWLEDSHNKHWDHRQHNNYRGHIDFAVDQTRFHFARVAYFVDLWYRRLVGSRISKVPAGQRQQWPYKC